MHTSMTTFSDFQSLAMKRLLFTFYVFVLTLQTQTNADTDYHSKDGIYIVYMGAAATPFNSQKTAHANLLHSLKKGALVHTYRRSFTGFAARLSEEEARSFAGKPGVVSVFPDQVYKLHTTRSWDFLNQQRTSTNQSINLAHRVSNHEVKFDTIIGIIDSGIWPEAESFNDKGFAPIPSRWKGTCMQGYAFNSSNCNRKLIGARCYYGSEDPPAAKSPRDDDGHGTHVASTAAGNPVAGASYYGLAKGTARGGSPGSRIAMYKACSPNGCKSSSLLGAFDDAIADGVDLISVSLGGLVPQDFVRDPVAIGGFHAIEKGILVVCSAGNGGPSPGSVVNYAPWMLTVAATTIDRDFQSDIVLGNNKVIRGEGINFDNITRDPVYPLIWGAAAKLNSTKDAFSARQCINGALDADKIKGKIVICHNDDDLGDSKRKLSGVVNNGGIGVILIDPTSRSTASSYGADPMTVINTAEAEMIISYINSTKDPRATILPTVTVQNYKPAPQVAFFSSRGPSYFANTKNILKPDIAAPGVDILAAWRGNDNSITPRGMQPPQFNIISGTSMACPHVAGIAALVKSRYPHWSPSTIRSAIMTTAINENNIRAPIKSDEGSMFLDKGRKPVASPYDIGAGEINPSGPLQPGLIYEITRLDYLILLCNYNYPLSQIKTMAATMPHNFSCPNNSNVALISNMNYPSISISGYNGKGDRKITRIVTNVGKGAETTYRARLDVPAGLKVTVTPGELRFTKKANKLSYTMTFSASGSSLPAKDLFGSITWTNGKYNVRSPFVVSR